MNFRICNRNSSNKIYIGIIYREPLLIIIMIPKGQQKVLYFSSTKLVEAQRKREAKRMKSQTFLSRFTSLLLNLWEKVSGKEEGISPESNHDPNAGIRFNTLKAIEGENLNRNLSIPVEKHVNLGEFRSAFDANAKSYIDHTVALSGNDSVVQSSAPDLHDRERRDTEEFSAHEDDHMYEDQFYEEFGKGRDYYKSALQGNIINRDPDPYMEDEGFFMVTTPPSTPPGPKIPHITAPSTAISDDKYTQSESNDGEGDSYNIASMEKEKIRSKKLNFDQEKPETLAEEEKPKKSDEPIQNIIIEEPIIKVEKEIKIDVPPPAIPLAAPKPLFEPTFVQPIITMPQSLPQNPMGLASGFPLLPTGIGIMPQQNTTSWSQAVYDLDNLGRICSGKLHKGGRVKRSQICL